MFTGIIETVGTVVSVQDQSAGRRITVKSKLAAEAYIDQSICINGACQSVIDFTSNTFSVMAIAETLNKTTLGSFIAGQKVNLERAMLPHTRLDGHMVQGHVDTSGEIVSVTKNQGEILVTVKFDPAFRTYLIPTGSISVDGISLTLARLTENTFTVAIIPLTLEMTAADLWSAGRRVNLEFDVIGKYVVGWMEQQTDGNKSNKITPEFLKKHGF